jgi:hypothetical protein
MGSGFNRTFPSPKPSQRKCRSASRAESASADALRDEAQALLDAAHDLPLFGWGNTTKALRLNGRGLWLARRGARELRVRVCNLVNGMEVESRALTELLAVEAGVREGFDALARHVRALARYETGDEILLEPEDERGDDGTPAAGWARIGRRV